MEALDVGKHLVADWTLKRTDRKSTRLNSSHSQISYAVFCLKKKNLIYRQALFYSKAPSLYVGHQFCACFHRLAYFYGSQIQLIVFTVSVTQRANSTQCI